MYETYLKLCDAFRMRRPWKELFLEFSLGRVAKGSEHDQAGRKLAPSKSV